MCRDGDRVVRRRPHTARALTQILVCHQGRGTPCCPSTILRGHVQPQHPKPSLLAGAGTELLLPSVILNPQLSPFPALGFTDGHIISQQSFAVPVITKKLPWSMQVYQVPAPPSLTWQGRSLQQRGRGRQHLALSAAPCFSQIQSPAASPAKCTRSPTASHPGPTEYLQEKSRMG